MKKIIFLIAFAAGFGSYAQVPDRLNVAVLDAPDNDSLLSVRPDFTFYSKNYYKVFDYYQYTFDAQKISQRSVYVSPDNKFYFGQNAGFIMNMPQQGYSSYRINSSYAYDLGGLVRGLKNVFEMEKDYSVKKKN